MRFCEKCGNQLSEGVQFCGSCGAKAPASAAPPQASPLPPPLPPSGASRVTPPPLPAGTSRQPNLPAPLPPSPGFRPGQFTSEPSGYLEDAPGARAANALGIWSLVFSFLLFPVGLVLAILAILKHKKAVRAHAEAPARYRAVGRAGFVTAIISLVLAPLLAVIGLVAAVAVPALLGQRARAKDKAAISTMIGRLGDIVRKSDQIIESGSAQEALPDLLRKELEALPKETNPWTPSEPACVFTVQVLAAGDESQVKNLAIEQARIEGQAVFMVTFPPEPGGLGYVAGAVRVHAPVNGSKVVSRVAALELPAPKAPPAMPDQAQKDADQARLAEERVRLQKQLEEAQDRKLELERQQKATEQRLAEQRQNDLKLAEQKKASQGPTPGQDAEFARMDFHAPLIYPAQALQARWELNREHIVRLKAFVGENGRLLKVSVIEGVAGGYGFNEAAMDSVNKSTFHPALRSGKPIPGWSKEIVCTFKARVP